MTPEELALYKKLTEKRKAQQKAMAGVKDQLFNLLTESYGATFARAKKDVTTLSLKDPFDDGNKYSVTFGSDEDIAADIDPNQVVTEIIENNLSTIEPIMGISNSLKVSGTYQDKKLFWQIRRLPG